MTTRAPAVLKIIIQNNNLQKFALRKNKDTLKVFNNDLSFCRNPKIKKLLEERLDENWKSLRVTKTNFHLKVG